MPNVEDEQHIVLPGAPPAHLLKRTMIKDCIGRCRATSYDLPKDVMTAVLNGASLPLPENPPEIAIDRRAVERVAQLLSVAKKPILYVGQGANEVRPPPAARRRPPAAARRRPPAR